MDRLARAERWYGRLLALYPGAHRRRFEAEMRQVFRELYRERMRAGRTGLGLWPGLVWDSFVGATQEYGTVMRSYEMKFANQANARSLAWGLGLMVPAGVFFLLAALGALRHLELPTLPLALPLLLLLIAGLPAVAMIINVAALVRQAKRETKGQAFVARNIWTLALVVVAVSWLGFLFGHDTVACGLHYLPQLQWGAFQHCAATH